MTASHHCARPCGSRPARLICCLETSKHGLYNSQLLDVVSWNPQLVVARCVESGAEHTLSHEFVAGRTRLGYCFTIASAQGRTLEGSVAVWDTRHPRFTHRHLVTCLSRGREASKVSIED